MRITHLGHACLLVETATARILLDPGAFSPGFDAVRGLDAILVTHRHPDHFDPDRGPALVAANPGARLLVEPETAAAFDLGDAAGFAAGQEADVAGLHIVGVGGRHAANHDQVPPLGNVGFVLGPEGGPLLFHPGDSHDTPPPGVDILALPLNAPWTRMSETLDFARAVAPRVVIPIHDGLLSDAGRGVYLMHVDQFGPDGATLVDLAGGASADLG